MRPHFSQPRPGGFGKVLPRDKALKGLFSQNTVALSTAAYHTGLPGGARAEGKQGRVVPGSYWVSGPTPHSAVPPPPPHPLFLRYSVATKPLGGWPLPQPRLFLHLRIKPQTWGWVRWPSGKWHRLGKREALSSDPNAYLNGWSRSYVPTCNPGTRSLSGGRRMASSCYANNLGPGSEVS